VVALWVKILRFRTKVSLGTPAIVTTCLVVFYSPSKQIPDYYFNLNFARFRRYALEFASLTLLSFDAMQFEILILFFRKV